MREIKFRAWNKDKNGWETTLFDGVSPDGTAFYVDSDGIIEYCPELDVVRYTGLKDRHGVEIYEGDVVNVLGSRFNPNTYAREDRIEFTGEVYWREDRWFIKNKTDGDYDNGDFYHGDEINWTNVKVIGNIYENPELIDGKE